MTLFDTRLSDKYDLSKSRVYLSGTQSLVRLCLEQAARDKRAGLNTAGYVTGYRGSPLGGLDLQFTQAEKALKEANIVFEPALNEDLAATAIWGTQQAELRGDGKYDGVFALWYGKGPGVDRSGDALRHCNLAGSAPHGGALVLMGDDHTCESSTTAHQSDYALVDAMIPILHPANIADMLAYGLHGIALSRFAGVYCGLKLVKDNVESSGSVQVDLTDVSPERPKFKMPDGGLNIRLNDHPTTQEARLHQYKLDAVLAYARTNQLDKVIWRGGRKPRLGLISTGKSYMDTLQALEALGIDEARADKLGLALYKVAMPWPLEPEGIKRFAKGLDQIIVIEEKRGLIEDQIKSTLYGTRNAPLIIGKKDAFGDTLFQAELALSPTQIAVGIGTAIKKPPSDILQTTSRLKQALSQAPDDLPIARGLVFCAGCPHNSSAKGPEGARVFAGIGCHWMAQFTTDQVEGYTHMGAEGANWIGEAKFSNRDHVFQNIGDGTYNHSGLLAIRAAVGAKVNMTYKVLFNDAVALTGGQANDGGLDVYRIAAEILAAGVTQLAFVADEPDRIDQNRLPKGITVTPREQLLNIQTDLSKVKGVTAIIYDQTCASEKRRRRKRGLMPDLPKRAYIHPEICEGCGDCSVQSSCVAIQPLETELGRKRQIDQSLCNKDFSCIDGFCPSFVTLHNATPRKRKIDLSGLPDLKEPEHQIDLQSPRSILVTGVGGAGVVTIGAIIGMAAHMDGAASGVIDMAGLSQKGGSVTSHIKLAQTPDAVKAIRVPAGGADVMLGCDLLVSSSAAALATLHENAYVVLNTHEQMPGQFAQDRDLKFPAALMTKRIESHAGTVVQVDATKLANAFLGDAIGTNMFMLGYAWQTGVIPISLRAIETAIRLNNVAVDMNLTALTLGRHTAAHPDKVTRLVTPDSTPQTGLDTLIKDRTQRLTAYQNKEFANQYHTRITHIHRVTSDDELTEVIAKNYYKLLAVKDEYEVARLLTDASFLNQIKDRFDGITKIEYHMSPPLLARPDPVSGKARKITLGPWVRPFFKILARAKGLRGKWYDPFGQSQERRAERRLIAEYEKFLSLLLDRDSQYDRQTALALAALPADIRGFGHVKMQSIQDADKRRKALFAKLHPDTPAVAAE